MAKAQIESLNGQVAQLQKQNDELRAQLIQTSQNFTAAKEGLAAARERLARKPDMPVSVSLRRALLGGTNVAVFTTTIKKDFPVLVTVNSRALGTSKQFRVQLNATQPSELGASEGAAIDIDDVILVENTDYEPATLTFHRK